MPFAPADLYQDPNSFSQSDWKEFVGNDQPGGGDGFSLENGEAVITALVPWVKARAFINFTLGFSWADNGAPYKLHRSNPQFHPRYPWLTAGSVSLTGLAPTGTAGQKIKTPGVFPQSVQQAQYQYMMGTVRFVDKPWLFTLDSSQTVESLRNTYFDLVPSVEVISAEGLNNIAWGFTPADNINGPPSEAIPAPFGTLMSKITYTLNWMYVPQEYISTGQVFLPTKILACVGRVNSATFFGFPRGTLLLQPPVFTRFRFPIQGKDTSTVFFGWNIKFPLQYFDPDRGTFAGTLTTRTNDTAGVITTTAAMQSAGGVTVPWQLNVNDLLDIYWTGGFATGAVTIIAGGSTIITFNNATGNALPPQTTAVNVVPNAYRGHQLVPWRSNLLWYSCLREQGGKLYPEADFNEIFKHISDPT